MLRMEIRKQEKNALQLLDIYGQNWGTSILQAVISIHPECLFHPRVNVFSRDRLFLINESSPECGQISAVLRSK